MMASGRKKLAAGTYQQTQKKSIGHLKRPIISNEEMRARLRAMAKNLKQALAKKS